MVSIILCTYNRAHTLRATLDSILAQTYQAFELIIVDDGSTDKTQELLAEYSDSRIRNFPLKENSYYCAAANYGMKKAEGEYIAFATSDDMWEKEKLEKQIAYLEKRKECGACFTSARVIDEDGEIDEERYPELTAVFRNYYYTQKDWIQRFILDGNCLCHPSAVVRREVMEKVGGYHLYYSHLADMELWLRILREYPIHVLEEPLVDYRCFQNAKDQISGVSEEQVTRSLNEHMSIRRNFINALTDEEMINFFGDKFQCKEACTHEELEIEKAFLLMHCVRDLPELWVLGMEKFEELLRNPGMLEVLKETYHMRIQDIHKYNFQHFYMDYGIHTRLGEKDREIAGQRAEIERQIQHGKAMEDVVDAREQVIREQKQTIAGLEEHILQLKQKWESDKDRQLELKRELERKEQRLERAEKENREKTELLNQVLLERQKKRWFRR